MSSFVRKTDPRQAQYARFALSVLSTLREAARRRSEEGLLRKEIADRIEMHPSTLARLLNGRVRNITIKTISDVLWATEYEPEFFADAIEDLCPNRRPAHLARVVDVSPTESMPAPMVVLRGSVGQPLHGTQEKSFGPIRAEA